MGELRHSEHFTVAELACSHCGKMGVTPELVSALEVFRGQLGKPILVNSGYRCAKHPVEAAKTSPGYHTRGMAADIRVEGMTPRDLYAAAQAIPQFKGFGVDDQQNYLHVDIRPSAPARWCYDQGRVVAWRNG